eukprot:TRINITY_DN26125_c0_g1_i1.p1 TRINITY_DN26125_c0_g1~~TRINITY_DN26125_c0_g1_i1.p1  ORF type:complete len:313 (-),score=51.32 TRINITY_DN26125_c0_g1_i1:29-967(-)
MAAVSMDSFKVKDLTEWTPTDVREFLQVILPGHPCVDFFTYTSGYVLCSMEKDDLRRQTRDEEAANVIWAELQGCKRAPAPPTGRFQARRTMERGLEGPPTITVYVQTRQEVAMEFQVLPSVDTVGHLKALVAEREGTPVESQRLISSGMMMADDKVLSCYDVRHGAVIRLVPQIRDQTTTRQMSFAPRGVLMVPGSKAWSPSHPIRPYMPVLGGDTSRGFPISMEFEGTADIEAFAAAAKEEPPVLCVKPPPGCRGVPTETRVHLDADTEAVRLDTTGNTLSPNSRYEATIHFGGRGGEVKVTLVTGADVA